ncbi:MAG: SRPBCC family protein [Bacteroidetes bacterium]|nr:SRPBCC family protein [Bacteroidota bacterium]
MHTYTTSIRIEATPEVVFAFHTEPANLLRITPPKVKVDLLRFDPSGEGAMVELRVRPLPFVSTRWLMRFDVFDPPHRLQDVQVRGPFRAWRQLREFISDGDSACILRDTVEYALPFGFAGRMVNRLFVAREIRKMFAHRQASIKRLVE